MYTKNCPESENVVLQAIFKMSLVAHPLTCQCAEVRILNFDYYAIFVMNFCYVYFSIGFYIYRNLFIDKDGMNSCADGFFENLNVCIWMRSDPNVWITKYLALFTIVKIINEKGISLKSMLPDVSEIWVR